MNQSSPKFSRDAEECSSSESGWTMYLQSSSMHGDTSNGVDDDDEGEVEVGSGNISVQSRANDDAKEEDDDDDDDDDDDSMASDASSGTPCKQYWHDDVGDVVKEKKKSNHCSSRKNHEVETGDVSEEAGNGDSVFIHGGSKMRRVKFGEK